MDGYFHSLLEYGPRFFPDMSMDDHPQDPAPAADSHQPSPTASGAGRAGSDSSCSNNPEDPTMVQLQGFDSSEFRQAVGQFATGVTVVTTLLSGEPKGMTVNSFSSVSLDPPMVLWNVGKDAESYDAFMASDAFALHILHAGQQELAKLFATRGADKFASPPWKSGASGMPVLEHCVVALECQVAHRYPGGDHTIIVGTVTDIHRGPPAAPLIFHQGRFAGS